MRMGLLLLSMGMFVVPANGAEIPTRKTKPEPLCGIPACYPYRPARTISPLLTEQSLPGLLLDTGAPSDVTIVDGVATRLKARYFQMSAYVLKRDHCSISRVSVIVDELGNYSVSFRADQNPRLQEDPAEPRFRLSTPPNPSVRQVSHLKRNEFRVEFRLLGAALNRETIAPSDLGRPVLGRIDLKPFWVQNGEPLNYSHSGNLGVGARYLDKVDRIEVDFSYR